MLNRFKAFIHETLGLTGKETILLAVSGGLDSVAMTHLFHQSRFPFAIAHCNFKLRGKASDEDADFVANLSKLYNVPFHFTSFETKQLAKAQKKSIQETARELRYDWFDQLLTENGYPFVATAHHLNDSVETIIYNLTKGTGIRGLHGILPKKGNVIRPLMFAAKEDFEAYAMSNKMAFREDASNLETKYSRNMIRHKVIPALKAINPSLEKTFEENIGRFKDIEAIYHWAISQTKAKAISQKEDGLIIELPIVRSFPAPATFLYELLLPFGFNYDQVVSILEEKETSSGREFNTSTHRLITNRGQLLLSELHSGKEINNITVNADVAVLNVGNRRFQFSLIEKSDLLFSKKNKIAFFDYENIKFPLTIRKWKQGDQFQPLGMNGKTQKVSDFLINKKVSIPEKEKVWIMESSGQICWIAGYREDERFKVNPKTKKILKVEIS